MDLEIWLEMWNGQRFSTLSKLTGKRIWRMDGDRIIQSKDILAVINKLYDENTRGDALKGRALALNPDVKNSLR